MVEILVKDESGRLSPLASLQIFATIQNCNTNQGERI